MGFWKAMDDRGDYIHCKCSKCGAQFDSNLVCIHGKSSVDYVDFIFKYCPICGDSKKIQDLQEYIRKREQHVMEECPKNCWSCTHMANLTCQMLDPPLYLCDDRFKLEYEVSKLMNFRHSCCPLDS